jgi:hypothetical protein
MPIEWPSGLSDAVLADGYSEQLADNLIRSPMDAGPPKVRRRGTSAPRAISLRQLLTTSEVATLETFYYTTTAGGSLSFMWEHPRTGSSVFMRFTSPPATSYAAPGRWLASYALEVLP